MNTTSEPSISLTALRQTIHQFVGEGVIDQRVIGTLIVGGKCVPVEGSLWDYKREIEKSATGMAAIVKDVAAFHNSYGGYLIVGVEENPSEGGFQICGIAPGLFKSEQLRSLLAKYVSPAIEATFVECAANSVGGDCRLGIIHIPKRKHGEMPATFSRNGPDVGGKPMFRSGNIPIRMQDESRLQQSRDDLVFLMGPRSSEALTGPEGGLSLTVPLSATPLENNLPDRNIVCSRFVGREQIIDELWLWLADPFAFVKVLAGDGGKGKTSIAYEFATQVAAARYGAFEQIVWLSAKKAQFRALVNEYQPLLRQDYSDLESLLRAVCVATGLTASEVDDLEGVALKAEAMRALNVVPSLVIVDDIDSTDGNEQKRILETAQQIGRSRARFLITTRANVTFSSDICLVVPGLELAEFRELIGSLSERLKINGITGGAISELHDATGGSPLLAESILRLVRQGLPLRQAMQDWKGQAGKDARAASLQKEIDSLSSDARRVLLVVALLRDCSLVEIKSVTGYEDIRLMECVAMLQGLFLVGAPAVTADEPRLTIGGVTRTLVLEQASQLVPDHRRLASDAADLRSGAGDRAGKAWVVGAAINQASAQLREGRVADAELSLREALKSHKNHKDLLAMLGRVLSVGDSPRFQEAERLFETAHAQGARRLDFLRDWYRVELELKNAVAAEVVAGIGVEHHGLDAEWWQKRAYARAILARRALDSRDDDRGLTQFEAAADDIAQAIRKERGPARYDLVSESTQLHDYCIELAGRLPNDPLGTTFDVLWRAERRGDHRRMLYQKMVSIVEVLIEGNKHIYFESGLDKRIATLLQRTNTAVSEKPVRSGEEIEGKRQLLARIKDLDDLYQRQRRGA